MSVVGCKCKAYDAHGQDIRMSHLDNDFGGAKVSPFDANCVGRRLLTTLRRLFIHRNEIVEQAAGVRPEGNFFDHGRIALD